MYRSSKDDEDGDEGTEGIEEGENTLDRVEGMYMSVCVYVYINI
jgi:hypothetical protein